MAVEAPAETHIASGRIRIMVSLPGIAPEVGTLYAPQFRQLHISP